MYGLGVLRLGFYMQSTAGIISNICFARGAEYSRSNSVAYGLGIRDSASSIEVPIFMALITVVSLPELFLLAFQ
jgi:hypothetical protein